MQPGLATRVATLIVFFMHRPTKETSNESPLHLIDPDPAEFKQLASAEVLGEGGDGNGIAGRIGGRTQNWAPIALSDGKLLIRDQKCVKVVK